MQSRQGIERGWLAGRIGAGVVVVGWLLGTGVAFAQAPATNAVPPRFWTGSLGAGLSLTGGNTDTANYNAGFDVTFDRKKKNVMKWTGFYLRGTQNGVESVNRTSLGFRDQYGLSPRAFVYGQLDYLRDTFKRVDYLVASTVGVGYNLADSKTTKLGVDGGVGVVLEGDTGLASTKSGAVTAGEKLVHELSPTATLKQSMGNLWKMNDMSDSLHTFAIGVAMKVSTRTQVSLDFLDTFKRKVPIPAIKKNDTALVASLGVKF